MFCINICTIFTRCFCYYNYFLQIQINEINLNITYYYSRHRYYKESISPLSFFEPTSFWIFEQTSPTSLFEQLIQLEQILKERFKETWVSNCTIGSSSSIETCLISNQWDHFAYYNSTLHWNEKQCNTIKHKCYVHVLDSAENNA